MRIDRWIAVRMRQELKLNEMKNERERDCKPRTRKNQKRKRKSEKGERSINDKRSNVGVPIIKVIPTRFTVVNRFRWVERERRDIGIRVVH